MIVTFANKLDQGISHKGLWEKMIDGQTFCLIG